MCESASASWLVANSKIPNASVEKTFFKDTILIYNRIWGRMVNTPNLLYEIYTQSYFFASRYWGFKLACVCACRVGSWPAFWRYGRPCLKGYLYPRWSFCTLRSGNALGKTQRVFITNDVAFLLQHIDPCTQKPVRF